MFIESHKMKQNEIHLTQLLIGHLCFIPLSNNKFKHVQKQYPF